MGRMEWFRDLRALFLKLSDGQREIVSKDDLIASLYSEGPDLELQDPLKFQAKSAVACYSFEQVLDQLNSAKETLFTWDQVIDYLIQLGLNKKCAVKPAPRTLTLDLHAHISKPVIKQLDRSPKSQTASNLVRCATEKSLRSPLHEYFNVNAVPAPNIYNSSDISSSGLVSLPLLSNTSSLLFLSLAGNSLTHVRFEWPPQLVLLNLSSNRLSDLEFSSPLNRLQLLRVSRNGLRKFPSGHMCKNLVELYADNNELTQTGGLSRLTQLAILDLSSNSMSSFEELAGLSILRHLTVIRVKENSLPRDYAANLKVLLPRVTVIDPVDITKHTRFQAAHHLAFKEVKAQVAPSRFTRRVTKPFLEKNYSETRLKPAVRETHRKPGREIIKASPIHSRASSALSETASSSTVSKLRAADPRTPSTVKAEKTGNPSFRQLYLDDKPAMDFVDELDRRLRTSHGKLETFSAAALNKSVSLVTQKNIQQSHTITYGNPIAALMIGPPASTKASRPSREARPTKAIRELKPQPRLEKCRSSSQLNKGSEESRLTRRTFDSGN